MEQALFQIKYPNVFLLLGILISFGIAVWYYHKTNSWQLLIKRVLILLRATVLFAIILLLLEPIIKEVTTQEEAPEAAIILDNSSSMTLYEDEQQIKNITQEVINSYEKQGLKTTLFDITGQAISLTDSISFDQPKTNLNRSIKDIAKLYEGRNLKRTLILTDGIYNRGANPAYANYNLTIDAILFGDTTEKKDIILQKLRYNRTARVGNDFYIEADIASVDLIGQTVKVDLLQNNKVVQSQSLTIKKHHDFKKAIFKINATKEGLKTFQVSCKPLANETNTKNNLETAYINIIKDRKQVVILASSPHPDIKAINSLFSNREQYETTVLYPFSKKSFKTEETALFILHQLPNRKNDFKSILKEIENTKTPRLFITSTATDLNALNKTQRVIQFKNNTKKEDRVHASINRQFTLFALNKENLNLYLSAPPLVVPYTDLSLSNGSQTLLNQTIGGVNNEKPLLSLKGNTAIFTGTGIWKWAIYQRMYYPNEHQLDELLFKVCQALIQRNQNVKFDCVSSKEQYSNQENPVFYIQAFNDLNEEVYNLPISLNFYRNDSLVKQVDLVNYPGKSNYSTPELKPGVYRFIAKTKIANKQRKASGQFSVQKLDLENINTRANKTLVRTLTNNHNGNLYLTSELEALKKNTLNIPNQPTIQTFEKEDTLLKVRWICFLILILLALEWGIRKRIGGTA